MANSERSLDRTLVQGIAWTGGVKWLTQLVSWAVTLVVARLLTPADYGLFGMAMVYLGLAQLAAEAGLLPVVIQPEVLDEELAARIGGLALMAGVAVFALSAGLASPVAWFFREERVRWLVIALSASFVFRGAQVLPRGLLARDLDFRRLAWIDASESMVAALATVSFALMGFRYWSLVVGALCALVASTLLLCAMRPHRITLPRELRSLTGSLTLGGHVVASQFAWYAYSNADFAVIGRVLGRAALGAYTLAWTIANVPVDRVTSLVGRVTAPIFAAVQHDLALLRRYISTLTEGLALVTLPACVGLALVADLLVRVMLGPAWESAIVPLRLLSLYAAFRCVTALLAQVLIFTGNAKRNMQLSVLAALVLPVSFYTASAWGVAGVAAVWVTVYPAIIGTCYVRETLRVAGMPLREYLRALIPATTGTVMMVVVVALLRTVLPSTFSPPLLLTALAGGGAAAYLVFILAVYGRRVRLVVDVLRARAATPVPSHVVEPASAAPRARLLLVSWHFPPDAAVGGLRWQKLARHAAERGWGVDVIMRDPTALAGLDRNRLHDLPPGTRLYFVAGRSLWFERRVEAMVRRIRFLARRTPAPRQRISPTRGSFARAEIGRPHTLRDVARAYFSAVEHWRGARWADDAARVGHGVIEPGVHRVIVSSGPPHFVHTAACGLAGDTDLPFAMDMRDPWSMNQRLPEPLASPVTLALAARNERRALQRASLVVTNTEPACELMRRLYPAAAARIIAVPNGYDDDPIPTSRPSHRFTIAYAGTIYFDRDPRPLFRAVAQVIRAQHLTPAEFGIELMGEVAALDGVPLDQIARDEGIESFVHTRDLRPRHEALEFLAAASLLVLLPQDSDLAIPAKLFEYMRFDAWVLALAGRGSATAGLLHGLDADVVAPDDVAAIRGALERRLSQHARGERASALARHPHLSRRARANAFFDALETLTGRPGGEAGNTQRRDAQAGEPNPASMPPGAVAPVGAA